MDPVANTQASGQGDGQTNPNPPAPPTPPTPPAPPAQAAPQPPMPAQPMPPADMQSGQPPMPVQMPPQQFSPSQYPPQPPAGYPPMPPQGMPGQMPGQYPPMGANPYGQPPMGAPMGGYPPAGYPPQGGYDPAFGPPQGGGFPPQGGYDPAFGPPQGGMNPYGQGANPYGGQPMPEDTSPANFQLGTKFPAALKVKVPAHTLKFDEEYFIRLLAGSISLSKDEKKKIVESIPKLKQAQIDELVRIFEEEKQKFAALSKKHVPQLEKLAQQHYDEWMELETETELTAKKQQEDGQADAIRKQLGI